MHLLRALFEEALSCNSRSQEIKLGKNRHSQGVAGWLHYPQHGGKQLEGGLREQYLVRNGQIARLS
jgi:hypothetical protein